MKRVNFVSFTLVVAILFGGLFLYWNFFVKEVAPRSDLESSIKLIKLAEQKITVLAKVNHLECSYKILCFTARNLSKVKNKEEEVALIYAINSEWNSIYEDIAFIVNGIGYDSRSIKASGYLRDMLELSSDPRNAPEKLPESIKELEEKINLLRKVIGIDYPASNFFMD